MNRTKSRQRRIYVLETVAGHGDRNLQTRFDLAALLLGQQTRNPGSRCRLDKDAFFTGQESLRVKDLIVADSLDQAPRLVAGDTCLLSRCRITDANCGGYGLGLQDRVS